MIRISGTGIVAISLIMATSHASGRQWRAGAAEVIITPTQPMWMSGYASRDRPASGKIHDLFVKALAIEDEDGHRSVLVTADLVGIDRELSQEICKRLEKEFALLRSAIALTVTHSHSGPVVGENLRPIFECDDRQAALISSYSSRLANSVVEVVGTALSKLQPANLTWGIGTASFAVNRRNNAEDQVPQRRETDTLVGPVDHDVPVLAVRDSSGQLTAIVSGYACHATVLNGYEWSGDWPGAAQIELAKRHPQAVILYWAGCGGDQNPLPRRSVELMNRYGYEFADAVDRVLSQPMKSIEPTMRTDYQEIDLPFGELPSQAQLEIEAAGEGMNARWARLLLARWRRDGSLPTSYPYPIQLWQLGTELRWIYLGGEAVVDYSIRLRLECQKERTWVTSYANDVMGYIPSRRVLMEGGYEGGGAKYAYGLPAAWSPHVEEKIISAVTDLTHNDQLQ